MKKGIKKDIYKNIKKKLCTGFYTSIIQTNTQMKFINIEELTITDVLSKFYFNLLRMSIM